MEHRVVHICGPVLLCYPIIADTIFHKTLAVKTLADLVDETLSTGAENLGGQRGQLPFHCIGGGQCPPLFYA